MFYPQEMTEIEIIVPAKHLVPVTKLLSGAGVFSQTDVNYLGTEKQVDQPNLWPEKAAAYAALERRLQLVIQALEIGKSQASYKDFGDLVDLEKVEATFGATEGQVKSAVDQISTEHKQIDHLNSLMQQLTPLADIDVDFSQMRDARFVYTVLGMMPPENVARLKTSLSRIPFVLYNLGQKQQKAVVWLACARSNAEVMNRAVRSAYLDPIALPEGMDGTPAEIIASLQQQVKNSEMKIAQLRETLAGIRKQEQDSLLALLWDVRCSHLTVNAIVRYGRLKYTYVIVGWIYSSYLHKIKDKLRDISPEILVEAQKANREKEANDVPVALNNPMVIKPFQMLVRTYSEPRYSELDPTPLVALIFPILFGAMFGDVGHGLIIALLGWLVASKKVKKLQGMAGLGPIALACGISAMIFGFLYGSFFGYEEVLHPIWMAPTKNIMTILAVTITGGVSVLSLGFLLSIYNALKVKDYAKALFNHNGLMGLILYWSLIGLVLPFAGNIFPAFKNVGNLPIPGSVFAITTLFGALGIIFSELLTNLLEGHRPLFEGSFVMYFVQGFFELFETFISFLSNTLSFVRVGAFAVAHGNFASVFFLLAEMVGPKGSIGYWLMYGFGLLFIVGFEGLIVCIQSMRLTYYEIFGKFFAGGGKRFESLKLQPAENEKI
jgi:V/A-type H+-transporting ATPase subunit I